MSERALVDRLAAAIQGRVLSGEIPTGSRLRQAALADEFGVSRTPVREALRKLGADGILELEPNRGAFVRGPSARDIREAYEVRAELEGFAAELAVAHIRDAELARLRDAQELFRRSVDKLLARHARGGAPRSADDTEWVRANDLFHETVQEAAGNERLRATIAALHSTFPRNLTWGALSGSSRLLAENVDQHAGVLAAIERHDAGEARRLMTAHVRRAGELVALRLEQQAQSDRRPVE